MPETIQIIAADADDFARYDEDGPTLIVFEVSKREIDTQNIASSLERLLVMTDSRTNVLRYRESVVFLVSGYDEDSRELVEISEVRSFFLKLTSEWPHWFWFLARGFGSISLLMALLCSVRIQREGKMVGTEFLDGKETSRVAQDLFARGNRLFAAYDIDPQLVKFSTESALRDFAG